MNALVTKPLYSIILSCNVQSHLVIFTERLVKDLETTAGGISVHLSAALSLKIRECSLFSPIRLSVVVDLGASIGRVTLTRAER